ncbi:MAG: GGDEF domain-containing protein, partial [Flavobacteriaceae bacterium]|nr:GGDEF domain-containing protein [Flavobacteriaceae bacterium]
MGSSQATQGGPTSKLVCEQLFDSPELYEKTFNHLRNTDASSHGVADAHPYLRLNSVTQLRFYTESPIDFIDSGAVSRVLKLEVLEDLGVNNREEFLMYQKLFQPESLSVIKIDDGQYSVGRWVPRRTVPVDIHTGFIRADSAIVTEILNGLVKSARSKDDSAMMFLDIDVLNLVNYLPGGHKLGDKYISMILRIISENLRIDRKGNSDIAFRMQGGD